MSEETDLKPCYKCKHEFDATAPECPKCQYYDLERKYDVKFWNSRKGWKVRSLLQNVWALFTIIVVYIIIYVMIESGGAEALRWFLKDLFGTAG
jgi:ribosomal protein L40E